MKEHTHRPKMNKDSSVTCKDCDEILREASGSN